MRDEVKRVWTLSPEQARRAYAMQCSMRAYVLEYVHFPLVIAVDTVEGWVRCSGREALEPTKNEEKNVGTW